MQRRMVKDGILSQIRANAGSKGGKAAKGKTVAGSFAQAKSKAKEQANTEYEYEDEIEDEIKVKGTKKRMTYDDPGFQAFWSAYPRKTAKANAFKAFEKLNPDGDLIKIMLGALSRWSKSEQWIKDNGQFIPHASTWLNGRRWEDELPQENYGLPAGYRPPISD